MVESQGTLASAVIVPELADEPQSPRLSTKRRNSSFSGDESKRPRLSPRRNESGASPSASASGKAPRELRASKEINDRKRGRRLFGALLGTLSQNSSSTAQRRRVDIEKKQQEKLKLQAVEYDENKKRQQESLLEVRKAEQVKYRNQSILVKHSNMLAAANFLHTKAEPRVYYKPWELWPGEEELIKSQIIEVQATIDEELAKEGDRDTKPIGESIDNSQVSAIPNPEQEEIKVETVGYAADETEPIDHSTESLTNNQPEATTVNSEDRIEDVAPPVTKETVDDGGDDVVEGEEDNVIY